MYDSESSSDGGWISWFCDLEGHEFFVEVLISIYNNFRLTVNTLKTVLTFMDSKKESQNTSIITA
jgi:hypothetical protein